MMVVKLRLLAAVFWLVFHVPDTFAVTYHYHVAFGDKLARLDVRLCFEGKAPRLLSSGNSASAGYLRDVRLFSPESAGRLSVSGGKIHLERLPENACIAYGVRLREAIDDREAQRIGDSLLVDIQAWLWRPVSTAMADTLELYFNLPPGIEIVGPWEPLPQSRHGYRLSNTPINWEGRVALGQVGTTRVSVAGQSLRICLVGAFSAVQKENARRWVQRAAANISLVYGRFPVPGADVMVIATGGGRGGDAVPWAQVQRGGRPVAQFFINEQQPLERFLDDWTPTHELAHLLHPVLERQFKWVYEGLASYYQNVARARGGQLTDVQAWQKLYDGFQRGLRESRETGSQRRPRYMEIYWRGAAAALLADVSLRKQSANQLSLDIALQRFQRCCFEPVRTWGGYEFFATLNQLTGTKTFSHIYERYASTDAFPDVKPVLTELGVRIHNGNVSLINDAPLAAVRKDIMAAQPLALTSAAHDIGGSSHSGK
ncbi:MAG: hypothetical protein P8Y42_01755 [Exilibacterium sp.]